MSIDGGSVTWAQALAWRMERQLLDPLALSRRGRGASARRGALDG